MEEKPKSKGYVLRKLFFACLYLSTFTFGGGYVIVTLLKEKFVDHYHWIEEDEMLDLGWAIGPVFAWSNRSKRSDYCGDISLPHTGNAGICHWSDHSSYGDLICHFCIL